MRRARACHGLLCAQVRLAMARGLRRGLELRVATQGRPRHDRLRPATQRHQDQPNEHKEPKYGAASSLGKGDVRHAVSLGGLIESKKLVAEYFVSCMGAFHLSKHCWSVTQLHSQGP
jgi:hypothetical protein